MSLPAAQRTVADLVEEYDAKAAVLDEALANFEQGFKDLELAATVQGFWADSVATKPFVQITSLRRNLLKSGWRAVYNRLNIATIASANDKKRFEKAIEDPAPLTFENAKATFGDYLLRPRFHLLRGLAEVFCGLDPAYKSHSKVKIGVKGLPKRVILTNVTAFQSWGRDKLVDMLNAMETYGGRPLVEYTELNELDNMSRFGCVRAGEVTIRGVRVKKFENGNAHVMFTPDQCRDINLALAEFYGDVLPDVQPDTEDLKREPSTAVSKDLQYYWSPESVVERALDFAGVRERMRHESELAPFKALEPSCGDGRILEGLRKRKCQTFGIEYDPGRAAEARAKGFKVLTANFLEHPPSPEFDYVILNPPFYGRHYLKHVRHAVKFLKPGGTLVAILPATARYDHDELKGAWEDLPVASFAESGTNVPTVLYRTSTPQA